MILAAYRIVKRKYREDLLSAAGGMYADGRWTSRGRPVVYTASSISLAILEFTVHYKRRGWVPACVLGYVDIPDELRVETVDIIRLPPDWRNPQPSKELREVGDDWLRRSRAPVLRVPSAIVPEENNLLLNPSHPDFGFITVRPVTDFVFDRRLARTARR